MFPDDYSTPPIPKAKKRLREPLRSLTKKENGKYVLYNDISILQFFIRSKHSPFVGKFAEDCDNLGNRPPKQRIDFAKYGGRRVEGKVGEKKEVKEEKEEEKEEGKGEEIKILETKTGS